MASSLDYSYVFHQLPALLLLGLVPIVATGWAHFRSPRQQCTILGFAAGAVAFPFCLGLYATSVSYVVIAGVVGMMISLALTALHVWPGFYLGVALGLFRKGVVLHGV